MVARRFSGEDIMEVARLYESGMSQHLLAERFSTSPVTVRKALAQAGVVVRRGGPKRPPTDEEVETIVNLYATGQSQEAIGAQLGRHQSTVSNVLRQRGIRTGRQWMAGSRHPCWNGGRTLTSHGYVLVRVAKDDMIGLAMSNVSGYVMEHRLTMAHALDRALSKNETVHHINGNKQDNRVENLQLRQGLHGTGAAHACLDCGSTNIIAVKLGD